ncbi:hypothetical protein Zmor_022127 [Zophobas morio]|uniref:Odorant receptor n=1 Tax=Zophobas morio TaxID=2755281 RepID=A0AA38M633_9CUCU|nr:hypothetical protein Zmor_022127 [Zophobas morio]
MTAKERTKDEGVLKFCRMLSVDFFETQFARYCQVCFIFYYVLIFTVQTIMFLHKFEALYFAQYSCSYFFSFAITILIALDPKSGRIYKSFMEEVKWWKSDSAGEEVERRIRRETLQLAILMTTNIVSSVVMSTAFVIPQKEDRNLFYEIALFEDFLPKWAGVLKAIYRTQAFFVRPFCVVAAFSQALYIFHNMRFQMYMILHFIKTINDNCENDQLIIKNRLLFCFKNYIQLSKALRRLLKLQWAVSLAYQIIIPPLIISTAVYGLLFPDYLYQQNFRLLSTWICVVFMLFFLFRLGQVTEDTVAEVYEALFFLEWYNWNESNKKTYLIFLLSSVKPFRIQFSENFSLNYNMAVQLVQTAASVVLVVYQLNFM